MTFVGISLETIARAVAGELGIMEAMAEDFSNCCGKKVLIPTETNQSFRSLIGIAISPETLLYHGILARFPRSFAIELALYCVIITISIVSNFAEIKLKLVYFRRWKCCGLIAH